MRFAALLGVAAANHNIAIDWTHYAKMPNLVQSLIKSVTDKPLRGSGDVTFSQCDDDFGDFVFDQQHTSVNPAPPLTKGSHIDFDLEGKFGNEHKVKNLHIHVDWNGGSLYDQDVADGTSYPDYYKFDKLGWDIPGYAPDGDYKVTLAGTDDDDKKVICISAEFTF